MNTIEEILKKKYIIKNESIYETHKREACSICTSKDCPEELHVKIDGTLKCENFSRCMTNKCKTCKDEKKCFNRTAKQNKPIMKGLV